MQVCENYIDAERIPEQFPGAVKADDVLSLETVVLGGLNFDLVVYHPYTFLDAMIEVRLAYRGNLCVSLLEPRRPAYPCRWRCTPTHCLSDTAVCRK